MYYLRNNSRQARLENWVRYFTGFSNLHQSPAVSIVESNDKIDKKYTYGFIVKLEDIDIRILETRQKYEKEGYYKHKLRSGLVSIYTGSDNWDTVTGVKVITYLKNLDKKPEYGKKVNPEYLLEICKSKTGLNLKSKAKMIEDDKSIDVYFEDNNKLTGTKELCINETKIIKKEKKIQEDKEEIETELYAAGQITDINIKKYYETVGINYEFDNYRVSYCSMVKIIISVMSNLVEQKSKGINFLSFNSRSGVAEVIILNRLIRSGFSINKLILVHYEYTDQELTESIKDGINKLTGISKSNMILKTEEKLEINEIPDDNLYVLFDNCNPKKQQWKNDKYSMGEYCINKLSLNDKVRNDKLKKSIKYILCFDNHNLLGTTEESQNKYPIFALYKPTTKKIGTIKPLDEFNIDIYGSIYRNIVLNGFQKMSRTQEIEFNKNIKKFIDLASRTSTSKDNDLKYLISLFNGINKQLNSTCKNVILIDLNQDRKQNDICTLSNSRNMVKINVEVNPKDEDLVGNKSKYNELATFVFKEAFSTLKKYNEKRYEDFDVRDDKKVKILISKECALSNNTYYLDFKKYLNKDQNGNILFNLDNKEQIKARIDLDFYIISNNLDSYDLLINSIEENLKLQSNLVIHVPIPEIRLIFLLISQDLALLFFQLLEMDLDYLIGNMNYKINIFDKERIKYKLYNKKIYDRKYVNENINTILKHYEKNIHLYYRDILNEKVYDPMLKKEYLYTNEQMGKLYRGMHKKQEILDKKFSDNINKLVTGFSDKDVSELKLKLEELFKNFILSKKVLTKSNINNFEELYKNLSFYKEVLSEATINNFKDEFNNLASRINSSMGIFDGKYNVSINFKILKRQEELELFNGMLDYNQSNVKLSGEKNIFMDETLKGYNIDGENVKSISGTLYKISDLLSSNNSEYKKKRAQIKYDKKESESLLNTRSSNIFNIEYDNISSKITSKFKIKA